MQEGEVELDLKQGQITCPWHYAPFAKTKANELREFGKLALLVLAQNPSFARGVEATAIDQKLSTVEGITLLLDRMPVCCRVKHQDVFKILMIVATTMEPWGKERCDLCAGYEYGFAPQRTSHFYAKGTVPANPHVCIRCIAFGG
jgi:hypothetical protein